MSGRRSRDKGKRGEREVVQAMRIAGFDARRCFQSRAGTDECDVEGLPYWCEVKRGRRVNLRGAIAQSKEDTDGRPWLVVWRDDRDEWMVTMSLEEWARLAFKAHNSES